MLSSALSTMILQALSTMIPFTLKVTLDITLYYCVTITLSKYVISSVGKELAGTTSQQDEQVLPTTLNCFKKVLTLFQTSSDDFCIFIQMFGRDWLPKIANTPMLGRFFVLKAENFNFKLRIEMFSRFQSLTLSLSPLNLEPNQRANDSSRKTL